MMMPTSSSSRVQLQSSHEDALLKKILQTHAPEERSDSRPMLQLAENIIHCITAKIGSELADDIEAILVDEQTGLRRTVHHISSEIMRDNPRDRSSHARAISVLELLGSYSWGTKVVIVLVALAKCYGEFWLILQLCAAGNPLALSIARLRGLGNSSRIVESVERRFKALRYLFDKMVDVAKNMVEFEILPEQYIMLDFEAMAGVKTYMHMAAYWVIRSSVACASQITSMCAMNSEQMHTVSVTAIWELWSSAIKTNDIHHCLAKQLANFYVTTEKNMQSILSRLFEEAHEDNQKILSTLFAMKNELPFKDGSSKRKVGVAELRNKEVIFFISRPSIKQEQFLLIVHQLRNQLHNKAENSYEIVWIPVVSCIPWPKVEERNFNHVVDAWPWYSLYEPSMISLSVLKFIHEVWHFHDDPVMVVLDSKGRIASLNAVDMAAICDEVAYPFSINRERELRDGQKC